TAGHSFKPSFNTLLLFVHNITPSTCRYTLFSHEPRHLLALHSFPTRRSSDLLGCEPRRRCEQKALYQRLDRCGVRQSHHRSFHVDRKSTRLNSSHGSISYAVFCLKKKRTAADAKSAAAQIQVRR